MRRADRLFRIVQKLRQGGLFKAAALARELEVSERTVYRDMQELMAQGLPIEGEAGVGYILRGELDLPPLAFTREELEALVVGARLIRAWTGGELSTAAAQALDKIKAVMPDANPQSKLFAPGEMPKPWRKRLDLIQEAMNGHQVLRVTYRDVDGKASERELWPLGLFFWGKVWTLSAWCELRQDFRNFRLDRFETVKKAGRVFQAVPGRRLEDYMAIVAEACGAPAPGFAGYSSSQ
jgi:predicted DNA-binding transcriptional regulator YafY